MSRHPLSVCFLVVAAAWWSNSALGAPLLNWDPGATGSSTGGGGGTWDTASWWNSTANSDVGWVAGDDAAFGGSTPGTVTILNGVSANNVIFNTAGYAVTGSSLALTGGTVNMAASSGTISSLVAGSAGLTTAGSGTLYLANGANAFTGGVNLNAGTLDFVSGALNGNTLNFNGGTLQWAVSNTQDVSSTFAPIPSGVSAILDTNGNPVTLNAPISGSGGITKVGANILFLNNTNTYSGPTAISVGGLQLNNANAAKNSTVSISGGNLYFDPYITSYTIGGLSGTGSFALNTASPAAAVTLSVGNNNANTTYSGVLSGSGGLTKIGTGALALAGSNTYTGNTAISGGALQINAANALPVTTNVTLANTAGATLNLNSFNQAIASLAGGGTSGGNVTLGAGTLTINGAASTNYSGTISGGSGGLTMNASGGTLMLSGSNTYTGATQISAGMLQLGSSLALPAATTLTVSGGTLNLNGNNATVTNFGSGGTAGVITDNSTGSGVTTLTATAVTTTITSLLKDGPTQKLALVLDYGGPSGNGYGGPVPNDSNNTYSGGTTLTSPGGGYMRIGVGGTWTGTPGNITSSPYGRGTITVGLLANDRVQFWTGTDTILNNLVINTEKGLDVGGTFRCDANTNVTLAGTVTLNLSNIGFLMGPNGGTFMSTMGITGQVTGPMGIDLLTPDAASTNPGNTLTLTLANTSTTNPNNYQGNTTVYGGGTGINVLALGAANQIPNGPTAGNVTINGTFDLNGYSNTINGLSGSGLIQNGGTAAASTLTVGGNNRTSTFSGVLINGSTAALGLAKTGAGIFTLSGTSTYTGGTSVNAGTLLISGSTALSGSGTVTVAGGATLSTVDGVARTLTVGGLNLNSGARLAMDWGDQLTTTATATPAGNVVLLPSGSFNSGTLYTPLTAGGGLGSGNYLLANNTTYTAALVATSASLTITPTTATALGTAYWYGGLVNGASGAMAFSNGASSNWSTTQGSLTSTGLVPGSTANVIFSANGATQESSVVLGANMTLNSLTFSDTTPVVIGNDGNVLTLMSTGSGANSAVSANQSATINAGVALGAAQTWNVANGTILAVGGPVSGGFGLTVTGGGTLTLAGTNTYSGNTSVSAGTLDLTSNLALQNSTLATGGTGIVFDTSVSSHTFALGGLGGSASLALQDDTSPTPVAVALYVGNNNANTTYSGMLSAGGSLTKIGTGSLALNGSNTYTGGTTVSAGTLQLGDGAVNNGYVQGNILDNAAVAFANPAPDLVERHQRQRGPDQTRHRNADPQHLQHLHGRYDHISRYAATRRRHSE